MSDHRSAQLLAVAIATLRNEILPGIEDPIARIKVDHVTRLLWDVEARLAKRETSLRALLPGLDEFASVAPVADTSDLATLERVRADAEQAICDRLPALIAEARADGGAALGRLVQTVRAFYIDQDPDVANGSAVVYRGGRIEGERLSESAGPTAIETEALTLYLRERERRHDVVARDLRKISGGFSKDTIFFSRAVGAEVEALVIRKDLPVPLMGKTVVNEYPLLTRLFALGFPVAEPLWLEPDRTCFGGSFLVSRRVAGSGDAAAWAGDAVRAKAACVALAKILAQLHTFTPEQLGYSAQDAARSAGACMELELAAWIDMFQRKRQEAFPLQELPLLWLRDNIPAALYGRPSRLVHGDVGFHNLMIDDAGTVTALLDWEFAGLGDPTQDLCFVRQFVEPLMPWPEFLGHYRDAGGGEGCEEADFFYRLWTKARNAAACVDAQTLFDRDMPHEMRFALAGHIFAPYMFIDQCEALLAHLSGQAG